MSDEKPRPRGKPFQKGRSGNPSGRKPGTKNHSTRAAEALLDGDAERLTRRAIDLALRGDTTALRLCLERIVPPRRDRTISFDLPPIATAADASKASAALLRAVSEGSVTPSEALDASRLVEGFAKVHEITDLERRLAALEAERKAQ